MGGGPHGGGKPASEGTGQAEAYSARAHHRMRRPDTVKCRPHSHGAAAPSNGFRLLHPFAGFTTTGAVAGVADHAGHPVANINERNLVIASASEEQAVVAREVDRNLVSISGLSVQTAAGANQTSAATQELTRLAVNLSGLVARFKLNKRN